MDWPRNLAQWNISRSRLLPIKSPAQSLDYRANSYHIHLSILGFHGYGEESNLPLPVLSYKYFLLGYSFSITSFYSPNSAFLVAALFESSKNSNKNFLQLLPSFRSSPLRGDGHQLRRSWDQRTTLFLYFYCIPVHPQSSLPNPFFFLFSFRSQKFLGFG